MTTTPAQLTFYNYKLHFTTAEIVISFALKYALSGASIPWGNNALSPLFQISPLFPKQFSDSVENLTYSHQISQFSSAKISDDFF